MKKAFLFAAPALLTLSASQAHAWSYTCAEQKISHKTLDRLSVTSGYGDFVTLRMSLEGEPFSVPTLLSNGTNDFISHDGDVEVSINPLQDSDGFMLVWIKVKSLHIKGSLDCRAGF